MWSGWKSQFFLPFSLTSLVALKATFQAPVHPLPPHSGQSCSAGLFTLQPAYSKQCCSKGCLSWTRPLGKAPEVWTFFRDFVGIGPVTKVDYISLLPPNSTGFPSVTTAFTPFWLTLLVVSFWMNYVLWHLENLSHKPFWLQPMHSFPVVLCHEVAPLGIFSSYKNSLLLP